MNEAEKEEDKKYIRLRKTVHNRSPLDHYTGARTIQNSLGQEPNAYFVISKQGSRKSRF